MNQKRPYVSIVTICYNSEATIRRTIKSVVEQKQIELQYIIIDGGSTDKTLDICNSFDDERIDLVSEPDKGLYDAMSKGIKKAEGDYCLIINSDDWYNNDNAISELVSKLKLNDTDVLLSNVDYVKNEKVVRSYNPKYWKAEDLLKGFMPPHLGIVYTKKAIQTLKEFRLDLPIAADYESLIRLFLVEKLTYSYLNEQYVCMTPGGNSNQGYVTYKKISKEIIKANTLNGLKPNEIAIKLRFFKKISQKR